jgi:hypothetical protein
MKLGEFEDYIKSFKQGYQFQNGLSLPFAWRGIYEEVGFDITDEVMSREEILENIGLAFSERFTAYKGGEYEYHKNTPIHFEPDDSRCSDGGYALILLSRVANRPNIIYGTTEERVVKTIFK